VWPVASPFRNLAATGRGRGHARTRLCKGNLSHGVYLIRSERLKKKRTRTCPRPQNFEGGHMQHTHAAQQTSSIRHPPLRPRPKAAAQQQAANNQSNQNNQTTHQTNIPPITNHQSHLTNHISPLTTHRQTLCGIDNPRLQLC
jgi:hypothetical protein